MSIPFTIHIATVSYQYIYSLYFREIHLLRFISCYCTSIYKKYVILLCFICNNHKTLLISQISNEFLCDIFKDKFSPQTSKYTTFQKLQLTRHIKHWKTPTHRKHWKTKIYKGSSDIGEGGYESDSNHLASVILRQYTTVTN